LGERNQVKIAGGSVFLLVRNKILSALWAADVFQVNALHIGGRNRKSTEGVLQCSLKYIGDVLFRPHL